MRYQQIKPQLSEEILDEVAMSPSALQKFARSPEAEGLLIGIEFEMGVPGVEGGYDNDPEWEADWSMNERAYNIENIIEFFRNGEFSDLSRSDAERLNDSMYEQFFEWQSEQIREAATNTDRFDEYIRNQIEDNTQASDYEDQAREELGQDASDDAVSDKANELRDAAVDEAMSSREGDLYYSAWDQALERFEEEMRDDGDFDQEAWLSDIGVNDMEEASSEFGLNWPYMFNANEGGDGIDVDTLADEFSKAMGGVKVNTSNNYHGARRDGTSWIIEPDSSIDTDDSDDAGLEFVSPPLPLAQGLETLQEFYAWAKSRGCYTNRSTGLHMNISVPDMTVDKLDYVKLALFLGDEYVLSEFERQYNTYAKSAMKIVREKIEQSPENAAELLAKMKQHLNTAASKLVHTGITNKYTSINTKNNYVEFRGPGGDYLDKDPMKLVNTALRLAMSLRIATDETAYKQEYAKKLYKLIGTKESNIEDPNNSVALFSRYALGQITKSDLVNNVRQAQTARRGKKGEEVQYWVMNRDGSGGKQMVFAASETDAIILGGKQIGLNREQSISRLRAELLEKPQDNNATRWKVYFVSGGYNGQPMTAVFVDADSPRQAKFKAAEIYTRQLGIATLDINELDTMEVPQDTGQTSNNDIAQAAGNAENAVRQSLPSAHREFLELITDRSDMGLIRTLSNPDTTARLNDQQAAYFRITVKHELRRRGINPDDVPVQSANEPAQQQQALEPDEPISSSDPEAASPLVPATSPAASDNNTRGDYEVYNPETMRIVSIIRGGTEIYADNKARELERDLGLPADSLRTRNANSAQGELDLQEMRRLSGLT